MQEQPTATLGTLAPSNNFVGATPAQRVVPLLAALQRAEELTAALAMRLDPVTNHVPQPEGDQKLTTPTVTGRIHKLGDTLQYLLENIEL